MTVAVISKLVEYLNVSLNLFITGIIVFFLPSICSTIKPNREFLQFLFLGSNSQLPPIQQAPKFLQEPESTIAFKGRTVTLYCKVDGHPSPTIVWNRDGKPVPSDGRRTVLPTGDLVIKKVINDRSNKPDVGVYQCKATNRVGTTVSRKVKLSVAGKSFFRTFWEPPVP